MGPYFGCRGSLLGPYFTKKGSLLGPYLKAWGSLLVLKTVLKNSQKVDRKGGWGVNAYGHPDRKISVFLSLPSPIDVNCCSEWSGKAMKMFGRVHCSRVYLNKLSIKLI